MTTKATAAKSIKFYCMVPQITNGQITGHSAKSTFHSPTGDEDLFYGIDTGPTGTLTVTLGSIGGTVYVYKLSDIVGRIEISV
ncbi:hypothetical protein [Pseudomonas sp.]|jgi:hypothetical protein|uniref:hypothetical protein n=1 Tax=Pseudomonas sp. TaxID=306 RepID=UPI0037C67244